MVPANSTGWPHPRLLERLAIAQPTMKAMMASMPTTTFQLTKVPMVPSSPTCVPLPLKQAAPGDPSFNQGSGDGGRLDMGARDHEPEAAAPPRHARHADLPLVRLDQGPGDRQAEAGAAL